MAGFNMTAGSITGSGTIRSSSGSPTLTVGTDNSTGTFGGIIGSGAITLVKVGNGVLGLSADNTYTGNTNIQVGALRALGNNVFGTVGSITVSSGASLQVEGGITLNRNISMVGTGVGGAGAIHNNSGDNTLSGTVTLTGASSIESQGGTLIFSATLAGGVHALTFSGNGNFSTTGSITGSGAVTKTGNGTLIIPTAKTFSGSKAINQGAINVQHANALGTSGTITVNSGGALQFEGGITFSRPFSINGTGTSNTGAIRNISGTNTLSGAITLSSASKVGSDDGTLVLSAATTLSGAGHDLTFGGNGSINVTGALSLGAGALVKENNGTTTLFVSNTYTGGTTTNAGILAIRNAGALGASGTITITPNSSLQLENNISVSRVLNINGHTLAANYTPSRHPVQSWKASVALAWMDRVEGAPLEGPLQLRVEFVLPRPQRLLTRRWRELLVWHAARPDIDNLLKSAKDALTGLAWRDDSQVCQVYAEKRYANHDEQPHATIRVEEV
jgi:autotransporter-associated beta strand protein